jgi:hypothetical protein
VQPQPKKYGVNEAPPAQSLSRGAPACLAAGDARGRPGDAQRFREFGFITLSSPSAMKG